MKTALRLWATCLGLGYLPLPGLCGSAAGFVAAAAARHWLGRRAYVGFAGVFIASSFGTLRRFAPDLFDRDPHSVVIDEACGALVIAAFLPSVLWKWIAALLAFRVLDNLKPFPTKRLERLPDHALAVFADDILVATYVSAVVLLIGSG